MMNRIYILPMMTGERSGRLSRYPKYIHTLGYEWSIIDYGSEAVCIALVKDISQQDHDGLIILTDVMGLPENLDQNMTAGAVSSAQTFLENLNIPANWISTNRTYRAIIKVIIGLFQFNQRWGGLNNGASVFGENLNLNTQYVNLSVGVKQKLAECFDTLNIDRSMLTNQSTIRQVLFEFGSQFAQRNIIIGGIIL